jgi:hypothetical protein
MCYICKIICNRHSLKVNKEFVYIRVIIMSVLNTNNYSKTVQIACKSEHSTIVRLAHSKGKSVCHPGGFLLTVLDNPLMG